MSPLPFILLSYFAIAAQLALAPHMAFRGITPNIILLPVVLACLNAPRETALTAAFLLGFAQDLATGQRPGLHALAYGLAGLFITATGRHVFRENPVTHIFYALVAQTIVSAVLLVVGLANPPHTPASALLAATGYTALIAPIALYPLSRFPRLFGFRSPDRRIRSYL